MKLRCSSSPSQAELQALCRTVAGCGAQRSRHCWRSANSWGRMLLVAHLGPSAAGGTSSQHEYLSRPQKRLCLAEMGSCLHLHSNFAPGASISSTALSFRSKSSVKKEWRTCVSFQCGSWSFHVQNLPAWCSCDRCRASRSHHGRQMLYIWTECV